MGCEVTVTLFARESHVRRFHFVSSAPAQSRLESWHKLWCSAFGKLPHRRGVESFTMSPFETQFETQSVSVSFKTPDHASVLFANRLTQGVGPWRPDYFIEDY